MWSPAQRRAGQLGPQPLDGVDLDDDPPLEILAQVETEIFVGRPSEAIGAGVAAAPVDVDRVAERHARRRRHLVDDRPGVDVQELHAPELTRADVAVEKLSPSNSAAWARPVPCGVGLGQPPTQSLPTTGLPAPHYIEHMFAGPDPLFNRSGGLPVSFDPGLGAPEGKHADDDDDQPRASSVEATRLISMPSPKANAPMAMLTIGSVTDSIGSDASSGPAWKALWASSIPSPPATTRAKSSQPKVGDPQTEEMGDRLGQSGGQPVHHAAGGGQQCRPPAAGTAASAKDQRPDQGDTDDAENQPGAARRPPCGPGPGWRRPERGSAPPPQQQPRPSRWAVR